MKKHVSILAMTVLLGGCALADDLAENKDKTTTQTEPPKDQKPGSEPVDAQKNNPPIKLIKTVGRSLKRTRLTRT